MAHRKPTQGEFEDALREGGNVTKAAAILGVSSPTLYNWIRDGFLSRPEDTERPGKRKLTEALNVPGTLEEADLKDPGRLLREHGLREADYEVVKVDLAQRENSSAKDPKIAKSISVTVAPKIEPPQPAEGGLKTTFQARPKRTRSNSEEKMYVVLGDEQAPNGLDEKLHGVVCQWLRDEQPDELIHIGDLGDFESVSSYTQLNPGQWSNSVQDCLDSSYKILGNYMANLPEGTRARYLIGNHEVRLQKYLLNQAKELYGLRRASEEEQRSVLDLGYLLRLDELGIELVESDLGTYPHPMIKLAPRLVATHGDVARRRAGTSAMASMENSAFAVIHGHVHRQAIVSRTVNTTEKSYTLQGAEIGCLCKANGLGYSSSRSNDWQQGFATVSVWPDGHYHIDLASYQNGVLVWRGKRWQS